MAGITHLASAMAMRNLRSDASLAVDEMHDIGTCGVEERNTQSLLCSSFVARFCILSTGWRHDSLVPSEQLPLSESVEFLSSLEPSSCSASSILLVSA